MHDSQFYLNKAVLIIPIFVIQHNSASYVILLKSASLFLNPKLELSISDKKNEKYLYFYGPDVGLMGIIGNRT